MDELEKLLVNGKEIDRQLVANILKPFLQIDRDTASIIPQEPWQKLTNEARILLFLIARRAMKALELSIEDEAAAPIEIEKETGIKGGTLRPTLKRLSDQKVISKSSHGRYFIPNYSIQRIKEMSIEWFKGVNHE